MDACGNGREACGALEAARSLAPQEDGGVITGDYGGGCQGARLSEHSCSNRISNGRGPQVLKDAMRLLERARKAGRFSGPAGPPGGLLCNL